MHRSLRFLLPLSAAVMLASAAFAADPAPGATPPTGGTAPAITDAGKAYKVPYRLTDTKHLLVRVRVNDKGPFNFIVDTGAPALFMGTDTAKKAGVERSPDGWGICDRVVIEGGANVAKVLARIDEPAQLRAMNAMGLPGARIDGVVGFTLLAHFKMEIDLTQPTMRWTRLDYTPLIAAIPPQTAPVAPLTPEEAAKEKEAAKGVQQMEGLANMASLMMRKQTDRTVVLRGFFGLELEDKAGAVRVRSVLAGSPAARGGLKAGDRVASLTLPGGKPQRVASTAAVLKATGTVPPGEKVVFSVSRGSKPVAATVVAGKGGL